MMHLKQNRFLSTLAATAAVLALGAAPALAGEDDDGDDDGDTPAAVSPGTVTSGSSSTSSSGSSISGAPSGGVATGAGGTAPESPDGVLLALASGALVLVATGGGLLTAVRRPQS
jgi:hypothetical protein